MSSAAKNCPPGSSASTSHPGRRQLLREIGPSEPAGVLSIRRLQLTPDGRSYTYNAPRNLTDLYVVEGLK
jgi:hypothetical protein